MAAERLKLLVGTKNPGKSEEVQSLLRDLPLELHSLLEFPTIETVEESESSYAENAIRKAGTYARETGMWALADDSGLEVDALDGAPGVRSARYAGAGATDSERIDLLLSALSNTEDEGRGARFGSVVAIADAMGKVLNVAEGVCEGSISRAPHGKNGFGYDPIFVPQGYDLTFAELSQSEKDQISHRARAIILTIAFLRSAG
jgi:XTP/dITP diphosphohydrolase